MSYEFRAIAQQAQAAGRITVDDILALRREGWGDGRIEPAEADAIFVLNDHLAEPTPEWVDFFAEAITEYVLAASSPRGFISDGLADWLIARIDLDARVDSMAELELLGRLFDKAERLPQRLKDYALAQIEQIVLSGTGPTRDGGELAPGCISDAECRLLRRFLFSFAGDTAAGVSRSEAELLFRIKDATLGADNAADWPELFVQAVGNHLMAHNRFQPLAPERAAGLEAFMNDATPRLGAFFGRMARSDLEDNFVRAAGRVLGFGRKGAVRDIAAEATADRAITEAEDAWLQEQVDANGELDSLDRALLKFIAETERG